MLKRFFCLTFLFILLSGCNAAVPNPLPTPFEGVSGPTVVLPTAIPPTEVLPTNTLVMANPWTPTPIPTATPFPSEALGIVTGVLNPETVVMVFQGDNINHTYVVRLLGVDAPNNSRAEPWGEVAFETLDRWLTGQIVRAVQDTTLFNADDELPRYIYLNDSFINQRMIELGLARPAFQPPDILFESDFVRLAQTAEANKVGLWGPDPTATPSAPPTPTLTATLTLTPPPIITATGVITASPVVTN